MRHKLILAAQWVFALAVVGFAGYALSRQWDHVRDHVLALRFHWGDITIASAIVLAIYALLIETWRRVLAAWDTRLRWSTATRIWFASSLGKYIPGNVWSIAALGVMARERGASSLAAAGSSILVNILNLASGVAVVLLCGSRLIPHLWVFALATVAVLAAAVAAPHVLPPLVAWLCRVTGRNIRIPRIPPSTVWISLFGTATAWLGYGVAFRFFALGILGTGGGDHSFLPYIAVYTGAYILGFVTPVAPAGLGVREAGIVGGLTLFGLMGRADALIVALTSRLWLTVLEVAPGLVALIVSQTRTRTRHA